MTDAPILRRAAALLAAIVCHGSFVAAVGSMAWMLVCGLQDAQGRVPQPWAWPANLLLLLQFPLLHSWLLSRRGRQALGRMVPWYGRRLVLSAYATSASLQLLLAFWLWTPSGVVLAATAPDLVFVRWCAFGAAWAFLVKALHDAGLGLQTGASGWLAVLRDEPVRYGGMPEGGLFSQCRQPIYLGFALVLWTAPCWTLDWAVLTASWSLYCVFGPRLKERRFARLYGLRFADYRARVPYMFPRFLR